MNYWFISYEYWMHTNSINNSHDIWYGDHPLDWLKGKDKERNSGWRYKILCYGNITKEMYLKHEATRDMYPKHEEEFTQ